MKKGVLIAFVTCPPGKGKEIAHALVAERLAACVNIIPSIRSVYLWQGKVEDEAEELLVAKTHESKWKDFEKRVKELHSYEVPEIICFLIDDGYEPYVNWLELNLLK